MTLITTTRPVPTELLIEPREKVAGKKLRVKVSGRNSSSLSWTAAHLSPRDFWRDSPPRLAVTDRGSSVDPSWSPSSRSKTLHQDGCLLLPLPRPDAGGSDDDDDDRTPRRGLQDFRLRVRAPQSEQQRQHSTVWLCGLRRWETLWRGKVCFQKRNFACNVLLPLPSTKIFLLHYWFILLECQPQSENYKVHKFLGQ